MIFQIRLLSDYSTRATDGGLSQQYENRGELTGENIEKTGSRSSYSLTNGGNGNASMKLSISGEKTVIDDNNARGLRPSFISIELYRMERKLISRDVTAKEIGNIRLPIWISMMKVGNFTI